MPFNEGIGREGDRDLLTNVDAYTSRAGVLFNYHVVTLQYKQLPLYLMVRGEHDSYFLVDNLVRSAVVAVENKGVFRFVCAASA
jgi:hypothetical protein